MTAPDPPALPDDDVATLTGELEATRRALLDAQAELAAAERARRVDDAVAATPVVDRQTLHVLVDLAMEADPDADPASIVETLRHDKPWLFVGASSHPRSTMSPQAAPPDELATTADAARAGDRRALLQYLHLRRRAT